MVNYSFHTKNSNKGTVKSELKISDFFFPLKTVKKNSKQQQQQQQQKKVIIASFSILSKCILLIVIHTTDAFLMHKHKYIVKWKYMKYYITVMKCGSPATTLIDAFS